MRGGSPQFAAFIYKLCQQAFVLHIVQIKSVEHVTINSVM